MKKNICLMLCFAIIFCFAGCGEQSPEKLAYDELINALEEQKVIAINPRVEQDSKGQKYITADVKNLSNVEVSEVVLAFAVWNYKGAPVIIKSMANPNNQNYEFQLNLPDDVKIPANEMWNGIGGVFLHKNCPSVKYVKAVVVSCKMGVRKFNNRHYKNWKKTFVNKTLEDWMK